MGTKVKPHYEGKYTALASINGDDAFEKFGWKEKIPNFELNGVSFKSNDCRASSGLRANARNFVVEKEGFFTIGLTNKETPICAIEIQEDVSGTCKLLNINSDAVVENFINKGEYIIFGNLNIGNNESGFDVTFQAGDDADFKFENIIVYYK